MKTVVFVFLAGLMLAGCVANTESEYRPPNYAASQATQSPAFRNDAFGGAAMPMRGLPR